MKILFIFGVFLSSHFSCSHAQNALASRMQFHNHNSAARSIKTNLLVAICCCSFVHISLSRDTYFYFIFIFSLASNVHFFRPHFLFLFFFLHFSFGFPMWFLSGMLHLIICILSSFFLGWGRRRASAFEPNNNVILFVCFSFLKFAYE